MYGLMKLEEQAVLRCQTLLSKITQRKFNLDYIPILSKDYLNNKRYCVVTYHMNENNISFCVIFRTQKFHSFGKIYENNTDEGETINIEDYNKIKNKVTLLVYCYSYLNEIKFISIDKLERLRQEGKVYTHHNNSDGKDEFIFNISHTKNIGEWLLF